MTGNEIAKISNLAGTFAVLLIQRSVMPTVFIPALLRDFTNGAEKVPAGGRTVGAVIDDLDARYPGIRARLCHGNQLASGIVAAVDTQIASLGLHQAVAEDSEVHFIPAIGGGGQ